MTHKLFVRSVIDGFVSSSQLGNNLNTDKDWELEKHYNYLTNKALVTES